MNRRYLIAGAAALAGVAAVFWLRATPDRPAPAETAERGVAIPALSGPAQAGKAAFEAYCAACHGVNAVGTDKGPPLLHPFYVPGHHGDMAFVLAARNGVQPHHWDFGPMPPVKGVTKADVDLIVAYVREMQRANGIE